MPSPDEIVFMPDRLNRQPEVFFGLTDGELRLLAAVNYGFWVPAGLVFGGLTGAAAIGLGVGVVVATGGIWVLGRVLRRIKRNKPEGYHKALAEAWLQDHGISRGLLRESAVWDIRAHRDRGRGRKP